MSVLCSIPGGPLSELPECKCSFSDIYQTTELANALHQIPHLNYMFQHVSSNFTYSTEYIQSVAFWAVCLIAFYLFLMVHLLLYSICMCRMVRKSRNTGWLKWSGKPNICLTIFGVLSFIGLAICAVGIWSDIEQNKTLINFVDVFKSVNNLISTLDKDIKTVPVENIDSLLAEISTEINKLPANTTNLTQYKEDVVFYLNVTEAVRMDINGVTDKLDKISLGQLDTMMEQGVMYRLIATLLVFCLTAIVLFASIIYAIKPLTRCTGFVFLFLVAFFLAVWWLLGSLAFSADIALADFCISPNPDKFIQSQTTIDPQYKEGTEYLLYCHGCANPFSEVINIEGDIQRINSTLEGFVNFTIQYGSTKLHTDAVHLHLTVIDAFNKVNTIVNKDLSCNRTSSLYAKAIQDGCYEGLQHFTIETSCAIVLAVIFLVLTTVQCFNSFKLISYYTNKNRTVKQDFQGLPDMTFHPEIARDTIVEPRRTPGFHQEPNRIGYTRTMNGSVSDTGYPINLEGYDGPSGGYLYPDLPLESFTGDVTGITIMNDRYFANAEYVHSPPGQDTNPSRASSMQDNLQAFFPEIASSIQSEESKRFSPRFGDL